MWARAPKDYIIKSELEEIPIGCLSHVNNLCFTTDLTQR